MNDIRTFEQGAICPCVGCNTERARNNKGSEVFFWVGLVAVLVLFVLLDNAVQAWAASII